MFNQIKNLAVVLWRRAIERGLDDPDIVSNAIPLGYSLGLDQEMKPLIAKMTEFSSKGRGAFKAFDLREGIEMLKKCRESRASVIEQYQKGEIPAHFLPALLNVPLVDLYHGQRTYCRSATNLLRKFPLYANHGHRLPSTYKGLKSIYIDVTALLLGADVGIMDGVEKTFKKIHIPRGSGDDFCSRTPFPRPER